jgi:hypothetical protein
MGTTELFCICLEVGVVPRHIAGTTNAINHMRFEHF